jgi:hypothetical protein
MSQKVIQAESLLGLAKNVHHMRNRRLDASLLVLCRGV